MRFDVVCCSCYVYFIDIYILGLIPANIGTFDQLTHLVMNGNHLEGVIPDSIGLLKVCMPCVLVYTRMHCT
jgi:hypothetical protein